jgi:hypothetical protein
MTDWIADGGQLIIQNHPSMGHRLGDIRHLGPMIERLIEKGWNFEFQLRDESGHDTYKLTKPKKGEEPSAQGKIISHKAWENYKTQVLRDMHPPGFRVMYFGQ